MDKEKILLVEDDEDIARGLKLYLECEGFECTHVLDGEAGLESALSGKYTLVILDIELPKRDGVEVLKEIRKADLDLPIIMLTCRSEETDKVVGLSYGADDYVTKPFQIAELLARIESILRRVRRSRSRAASSQAKVLRFGELVIELDNRRVKVKGEEAGLTPMEFDILAYLASHPGRAFSKEELVENVWKYDAGDYSPSVYNMIMRIRKKIEEDPANPIYLETVRGHGYRFAPLDKP